MATAPARASLADRLDAINEYDREPVPESALQGPSNFAGLYAGEHVAGTEFVIGPLFVAGGASAIDLVVGLLVGNLLATLSWGFLTGPIATRTRLNLYWQLRKIAGPWLLIGYNLVNAAMFCFLAGSMIAVSATAVGLPFDMPMPGLTDVYPTSASWVVVVLLVGAVVTALAVLGFEKIAVFSKVASPWMFLVFVACGIAVLPQMGVTGPGDFWRVANDVIWTGVPLEGQTKLTVWHILFFAWFANMAMHIGMADMTILRYAKKWQYGFFAGIGMYLGHFVAWIAASILYALALQQGETSPAPGPIAYLGAGYAGVLAVVIAGWTTANPTIYRAGLALQTVTPGWKRWKVTAVVGAVTTVVALFPAVVMNLLGLVALYGLILMPMGAVIFADFWLVPKLGLRPLYAEWRSLVFSWPTALAWLGTLAVCWVLNAVFGVGLFFLGLPGWFVAVGLYLAGAFAQQRGAVPEPAAAVAADTPLGVPANPASTVAATPPGTALASGATSP